MSKKRVNSWIWILVLGLLLIGIALISLSLGSAKIPPEKIIEAIFRRNSAIESSIILNIRLPRILLGFAVGSSLGLSGVILQGMFRNPLVEPYTLGISGAAALGVGLNILLGINKIWGAASLPASGFMGAILVTSVVYFLSVREKLFRIQGLLLSGVMISFISSSVIMLIMAVSRTEELRGIIFWIMGSMEETNWFLIKTMLTVSLLGLLLSYLFCFDLNALSLGEEEAWHLGINVDRTRRLLFLLTSLLTGVSVSVAGIIGFVGLAVPHFIRRLAGSDYRVLLISSFLGGGAFLIFSDTLARTSAAPLELPVGVITGIIGGSLFLYFLHTRTALH